ncbi:MAG TPA: type II secretion system protein [Kofleriaceae bacterium]|nr:type II secretion system protein [Kofleriaceae bacterium]
MRDRESGFTLIELMVTVVVIAILASIALPSFFGESRKTRAMSEVQPMFNDLRVRFEQYLQENGKYPANQGEATFLPPGAPSKPRALDPSIDPWKTLKFRPSGEDKVICGYTWATGLANDASNIGGEARADFNFTVAPASDWYYLLAKCDMDGDGATFSWYFTSSVDPTIKPVNEGK